MKIAIALSCLGNILCEPTQIKLKVLAEHFLLLADNYLKVTQVDFWDMLKFRVAFGEMDSYTN